MPPTSNDPQSFVPSFPPLAAFGGSPLYVTGEDALCATVFNGAAGVTVTITGRMLEFGQTRPSPFTQTLIPATDRSASAVRFSLGDGWLLNAQVIVSAGTPSVGQTFARLSLVRGLTANAVDQFTLAADYVTAKMPLSYPGSGVLRATEGAGALRSITGSVPAAGAEVSESVPTGARWELIAFRATLTSSATVATRVPQLSLDDGTTLLCRIAQTASIPASASAPFAWVRGALLAPTAGGNDLVQGAPLGFYLGAGYRLRTVTAGIQAADQWSATQYLVREWIEGA